MRTILRKLFGASTGGGACLSFFVFALTGLISGIPLAARAQDSVTVGTVTFRDKEPDSIVADGVLSFTDLTQADASTGEDLRNKFQTHSTVGLIDTFFSPRQTLGSGQSWTATFTATETITFDSVRFGGILCYNANWGGVQTTAKSADFTITAGGVTSAPVTINWPGAQTTDASMEATVSMGQTVTLEEGETLTLLANNGNDVIVSFGFSQMEFIGSGSASQTVEWEAEPEQTGKSQAAFTGGFTFRLDGLQQVGDQVPNPLPATASLSAVTVEFLVNSTTGAMNQNVRHLALTDEAGSVLAVSAEADPTPVGSGIQHQQIVFSFPGLPELSLSTLYKGHFTATAPEVGSTFDASSDVRTRISFYQDQTAIDAGNQVNGFPAYCLAASFSLQAEVEEPLGALNINFDTNADRLADDTLYGIEGAQYPGSQWNTFSNLPSNSVTTVTDVLDTNGTPMTVSYYSRGAEDYGDAYAPLLRTILLDNIGDGAYVQVEDIPYESYDVYVYMTQNSLPDWRNGSIVVNDTANQFYYMPEDADAAVVAETATRWGGDTTAELQQVTLGQTVMRIAGLSGDRVKLRAIRGANGRGNIAAVQIVEVSTEPEPTHWEGTINADVEASALMVSNGTTQKALSALTEADSVELAFEGTVSLNVDTAVTVDALTLVGTEDATLVMNADAPITAAEIAIEGGTVRTAEGTFVSEAPINLAEGTTLQIQGADGASFTQAVIGAGAVEIYTGSDVTVEADFTHTGGTTVNGVVEGDTQTTTTLRYAGHAVGSVTVGPGGVFDLNGHACAQSITLNGGTLRADEAINETVGAHYVASVDFNNSANGATAIPSDTVAGVLGMRGEYWTVANGSNGNGTLTFYAETAIAGAGAARAAESTLSWDSGAVWGANSNWQYLHGYLDDRKTNPGTVTLSIPEAYAEAGYALYLYSNTDDGAVFSAREIIGDDGVTTAYTYVNGALTTGNTTGWGNINAGRTTVAEGTNLMVIPDLHHRGPVIRLWDRTLNNVRNRGCLAALQIVANSPTSGNVAGSLSVTGADSKIEIADGLNISFVGAINVSGEGTLSKEGTGTMTLLGAAVTGDFAITEGVAALNEATVSGTVTVNGANGLSIGAGSYEEMTINLPEAATAQSTVESVTIGALTGAGDLDLSGATGLTLANATDGFTGDFLNATDVTLAVAGGTFAPSAEQIAQVGTLRAEGGTLTLPTTEVASLEVAGGTVDGQGGASLAAYTEISAGSVALTAAGTAASARPAMVGADDATVENFTLAEGGTIRYNTPDDRDLYFPAGFIPFRGAGTQPYVIVLGEDFADFATFPFSFTVLGADTDATFTLQRPDGTTAPESSYTVDGSSITIWNVGAIIDYSDDLPQARYHYAFDENLASTGSEATALTNENAVYVTSENGQALSAGSPYVTGISFSGAWTLGLYLNVAEAAPQVTLLHAGVQAGFTSPGALFLTTGETADEIVLWRRNNSNNGYDALVTADLGLGGANAWHHVLITHTDTRIRLYVDGEMVGEVDGTFENTYNGIQIGKGLGGNSVPDHTNGAGSFQLDDVTIWPAALRDVQIEKALATTTGAWRIREGETPAELFTANAPWTRTNGSSDVFAAADEDASTLTARATLFVKAGADELFTALQSFTARYVLLDGEPLAYAFTADAAPTLPDTVQTLVVDNDLTLDLSAVNLAMASQIAAAANGHLLLPGVWRGTVTLTNVPEGFDFTVEVRDTGLYLSLGAGDYPWSLSFDTHWDDLPASTLYGMDGYQVAGTNWNTVRDTSYTVTNPHRQDGTTQAGVSLSVVNAGGQWYHSGYGDLMMKGTTDGPSRYAFTGLPAGQYEVVVYFHTRDDNNVPISPVKVIGGGSALWYTYAADASEPTASDTVPTTGWGDMSYNVVTQGYGAALGKTVLKAPATVGMDGTLTIEVSDTEDPTAGPGLDWQLSSGVTARGFIAGVQVVAIAPMPLYTRTVSGTAAWTATGAWTNVNDGTTVDVPPEGARLMVESTDASILTVDGALPAYDSLTVVGGGSLALSVDGQNLLTDDEYRAIPQGQSHTVTVLDATIDPTQVTAWVSALKYGATATVSATETGITVSVRLPDAAYPETQPDESESISFNFWDFTLRHNDGGQMGDNELGATGSPYETLGVYWNEPASDSDHSPIDETTMDLTVVPNANRTTAGATTRTLTGAATFQIYHTYDGTWGGSANRIMNGFANGHYLGTGGTNANSAPAYVAVKVPEDWGTYTAVIHVTSDTGTCVWMPKRVNGKFYTYTYDDATTFANPQLKEIPWDSAGTDVSTYPNDVNGSEVYTWGSGSETTSNTSVEGVNMMVVPGLTGDFRLEWWDRFVNGTRNIGNTQGRVAAFQLIENAPDNLPNLDAVQVYQAELTAGENTWAGLQWTINGQTVETAPEAEDLVELTLTNDATLTFDAATTVSSITVYGQGHALRVTDAANATATWHFLNDTILALGADTDILPATIGTNPKRVRYDYAYEADYTSTTAYETEFAAGFTGNLTPNGGLVEFSAGQVTVGTWNDSATATNFVFSGDVRLTMTGTARENGLHIGTATVTFRDSAQASLSRIHLRSGGTGRTSTVVLEDNAVVTVTGAVNNTTNNNDNTLQFADWSGTASVTVRDNARFVATGATMLLTNDGSNQTTTITVEDNAEVRVKGVARRSQSIGVINLNGGRFLIGSDGFRVYSAGYSGSSLEMHFNGGALGAWQDWTWDGTTAGIVTTVTGDPILETSRNVTLTLAAGANLFATALETTVRGEGTITSALTTLPSLTFEGGTFETTVAAQAPSVSLEGGTLALSDVLTVVNGFESHGAGAVRIPVSPSGADGWLAMAEGGLVPNVANVVFTLALDLAGAESLLPYRVPLFMGAYRNNVDPTCGFAYSGNVNNAVSTATPVYVKGNQGQGLYAQLTGNAVVQPHTQILNDEGYTISQATASVYDYWIFKAETAGGKLTITDGGIGIKDVSFEGLSAVVVASGTEPHTLLQTETLGLSVPVTFDLTAWATALNDWAAGAVNGVPASLCLASGQVSVETTPTFIGWDPPAGVTVSVVAGERGLYLVATSDRLARTVSVNFSTRANPLSSTPAAPGAYAVPVAAWNDLQGLFSSALLYVSDIGGAATVQATRGEGEAAQPTQVSSSATATVTGTAPSLLQVWLNDTAASTLRVANVPFNSYRLALVFSCDIGDAAFATVTVGSDTYAMDAAGYVRKNITGLGKVAGDTQWGSTTIDTANYFRQGNNVLLTDVITAPSVTVSLPASVYGRLYTGVAAVQVIEAPATETSEEGTDYFYEFTGTEGGATPGDPIRVDLETLSLSTRDPIGSDPEPLRVWQSGPNNTLTLTVPEGLDVTLTLPLNFQADRISATGAGSLTLLVEEDGGAALNTLNADGLGNLTVHFPCIGVAVEPADGVTRFEAAFDNAGAPYIIADGATLALGADSGIAVSLDGGTSLDRSDGTVTLLVDPASTGTLRRDYPVSSTASWDGTAYKGMTWAFRDATLAVSGNQAYVLPDLLIEAGDDVDLSSKALWFRDNSKTYTYTQTGGLFSVGTAAGDRGFLIGVNTNVPVTLNYTLSGGRFETSQLHSWINGSTLTLNVSGDGVLALANGLGNDANNTGAFSTSGANSRLLVTFTEGGTLEPTSGGLGQRGEGTKTITFTGGAIRFGSGTPAEVDMTMPVTFAGTTDAPTTLDPGKYGTLVLNAANTAESTAAIAVPQGTVALANANGLGNATVTVADGAAFESRGFTGENEASGGARTVPVVAIKLDIPAGVGNSDGTAIQELCLYNGEEKVAWPSGTTISATGNRSAPTWSEGGNEYSNALIDGVTGNSDSGGTWTNPSDGTSGTYTGAAKGNKWYPITNNSGTGSATIDFAGTGRVFDSYTLWCSDLQSRFPSAWTFSVRYEGEEEWTVISNPTEQTRPAANTESAKYAVSLKTTGGATELDEMTGTVNFQDGAQCRATRKSGTSGFPYVARIAGTIDLPDSGKDGIRFFLDGEEFAIANVTVNEGNGTVTFGAGGPITVTDVIWDVTNSTGMWADGEAGPWVGGATFRNGAGVSFPAANGNDKIEVSVLGAPRPDAFSVGGEEDYTFSETEPGDRIDLSAAEVNEYPSVDAAEDANDITVRAIELGAATYDVPINTGAANRGISANGSTIRLAGALSADGKTATLLGSGNLNAVGASPHGVWFDGSENPVYLTLSPHAGECQTLSPYSAHLKGAGTVTVTGQVTAEAQRDAEGVVTTPAEVSGGTVELGGTVPDATVYNNAFTGTFEIRDGATLDFTLMRGDGSSNVDDLPFFRNGSGNNDALYRQVNGEDTIGFTLRNGGTLRVALRGLNAGWDNCTVSDIILNETVLIGANSTYFPDFTRRDVRQYMIHSLRMDGDGATLRVGGAGQGTASNRGLSLIQGTHLTVAGIDEACDPDSVGAVLDEDGNATLARGIVARVVPDSADLPLSLSEFGLIAADPHFYFNVGTGSELRIEAPLASAEATPSTATFVKRGLGRLTLTAPESTTYVGLDVEEGTLGGTAALTHVASTINVASGATIEAGLSVTTLTVEPGATLAIDPTGALQLRADTALFANGGAYLVEALTEPADAAGREPIKVVSWANAPEAVNVAFQPGTSLTEAGYGLEVRTDGLYLMPTITYYRELEGLGAATGNYQLSWDARAWYTSLDDVGNRDQAVTFDPQEGVTANVVLLLPEDFSGSIPGILIGLSGTTTFSSIRVARTTTVDGVTTVETVDSDITYSYNLRRETPPNEGEVKVYEWLTSLVYITPAGPEVALLQALVPSATAYTVDGTSVILYRVAEGRAAINISFAAGTEGTPSWLPAETSPCGPVPYAGVYWNNIAARTGTSLTTSGANHEAYQTDLTVSGMVNDDNNPATATLTYAYSTSNGFGSVNNRTLNGNARLAAGFLRGAAVAFNTVDTLESPGANTGWTVRVSDIPFTRYDLYLLFAGSADGAVTYPAVRVKVGNDAWRTYSFVNGWTSTAGNVVTWAGQGYSEQGFVQGLNLLHLRIEGPESGSIQIAACDSNSTTAVGLAGLQLVALDETDPVYYRFTGSRWGDDSAWLLNGETVGAWSDATAEAPHYARFSDTSSALQIDREVALPFLRFDGVSTLTVTGEPGFLSTGGLDFTDVTSAGTITFAEDVFANPPEVLLGSGLTLEVPEPEAGTLDNDWRWRYGDTAAHSATLRKTKAGSLRLTQSVGHNFQIDNGTLWLTAVTSDTSANYPYTITGGGSFGWAGGNFRVAFNNLPTGDNDPENAFLRVSSGTVTMAAVADSSLPADRKVIVSDGATLQFNNNDRSVNQRPFPNGTFLARDGGIVHYNGSDASNTFKNNAAATQLPSVRLESGMFQQTVYTQIGGGNNASVHDVYEFVSSGDSRYYVANAGSNAWNHKALNVRSGRIQVEAGTLGIHSNLGNGTGSKNSVVLLPNADLAAEYGDSDSTHGYLDVATGAVLLSHYPIYAGSSGSNNTLAKVGGGVWVQTQNVCQTVGYNGGGNANTGGTDPYCNIEIREGTFRLNMGDDVLEVPADTAARTITVQSGTRMEGSGTVSDDFDVTIASGATLLSGFPADVTWVPASSQWTGENVFPNHFKGAAGRTDGGVYLAFQGDLTFQSGAILEVNLGTDNPLTTTSAGEEATAPTVRFEGTLTVRLVNMPMSITEPVQLTNFAASPSGLTDDGSIICPEAIAIDAEVRLCTEADAYTEANLDVPEDADATIRNLWLIPSGASHRWTDAAGSWSEAKWHQGDATVQIPDGNASDGGTSANPSNPTSSPTARVESANGVILTIDDPSNSEVSLPATNTTAFWGVYGLILTGGTGGDITLAQGGSIAAGTPNPSGELFGVDVGAAFWKLGDGSATIDALLRVYNNDTTFTVSGGNLTLRRPILVAEDEVGQGAVQLRNAFEIASGAKLTLDFTLPENEQERTVLHDYYRLILGAALPSDMSAALLVEQTQALDGALTGNGTLSILGSGTTVRLGGTTDSGVNFEVGEGTTLALTGALSGGGAAERTATVATGGILDLQNENALGSADWTLTLAAGADDEDTTTPAGALVRTDGDVRLRGTVTVTGTGSATLGTYNLAIDDALTVDIPVGATLDLAASNVMTPTGAPEGATFTKTGAGVLDITSGNFELGLPVSIEGGTLRLSAAAVSPSPSGDRTIDWNVRNGGTLAFAGNANSFNLDRYGALTVEAGGTLALTDRAVTINGDTENLPLLDAGSTVSFGNGLLLPASTTGVLNFANGGRVGGTVTVVLNVPADALPQQAVTLISFGEGNRQGNGEFILGGSNAAEIAAAGYTLHDNGDTVTLEPFGGDTLYTWAATGENAASSTDWAGLNWVAKNGTGLVVWPTETDTPPAVILPEASPLTGNANIPAAFRTISWTGEAQTLSGLQVSNNALDEAAGTGGDYTLTGSSALTIEGTLLKTGTGGLTFSRPASVSGTGALTLFGGTVTFGDQTNLAGAAIDLNDATLAFTGDTGVTLSGRLAGNGTGIVRNAGRGTLTVSSPIGETIDRFDIDAGELRLTADYQASDLTPTFDMAPGTTLALGGAIVGGEVIKPTFTQESTDFTLRWEGAAGTSTTASPVLGAVSATTFVYQPVSGHLILDPESLPEGAALVLGETVTDPNALRLGAGEGTREAIRLSALTAPMGAVIGVEPTIDLAPGDWATERALTLAMNTRTATCGVTFMGATLTDGTTIRAGLTVEKAAGATENPTLVYIGNSDHNALGTLTAGDGARVEVTGTWAGPAVATVGGTLAGSGTIGAPGTTEDNVEVVSGGTLSATETSGATGTIVPATLTVQGDLAIHDGASLNVSAAVQDDGTTTVSNVVTDSVTFVGSRVNINVYLDAPADAAVNGKPILTWSSLNGTTAVTGTVYVRDADGNWVESQDYSVTREGNSLVLRRASGRFWMILR